jgi:negative regulator of sigma E activity
MTISEEALMAYADGEADEAMRASVETAMREDPEIAKRVERHRAMRATMQGAFAAVIEEPVPERLIAAARGQASSTVVEFAGARQAAQRKVGGAPARRWQPAALAASLLLGLGAGYMTWHGSGTLIEANSRGLVASAALADALSMQLSGDRSADLVAITGLSFRNKAGGYCRTFSLSGAEAASGLACRDGARWQIRALAQSAHQDGGNNFRMAGSTLPPSIRAAVEESIDGEPLDRTAEIAARQAGWTTKR